MNVVRIAAAADLILGIILTFIAGYFTYTESYALAGVFAASALVSFLFAKIKPSRWIAKQLLLRQLK